MFPKASSIATPFAGATVVLANALISIDAVASCTGNCTLTISLAIIYSPINYLFTKGEVILPRNYLSLRGAEILAVPSKSTLGAPTPYKPKPL